MRSARKPCHSSNSSLEIVAPASFILEACRGFVAQLTHFRELHAPSRLFEKTVAQQAIAFLYGSCEFLRRSSTR
jgi:hypothetical protein